MSTEYGANATHQPAPQASCSICQANLDESSEIVSIVCGHVFHNRCVSEWLKQSQTCPQCRKRVRVETRGEIRRIYLSFGSSFDGDDDPDSSQAEALSELRKRLQAAAEETETAKKELKRMERRDAQRRRDLTERQRQIKMFTSQLETCQESIAQKSEENHQLMQLLAQEQVSHAEVLRLRDRLEELEANIQRQSMAGHRAAEATQRLQAENADLRTRLDESERELEELVDSLESERVAYASLTDQFLAAEAASFDLSKRLTAGHADFARLAARLRKAEATVGLMKNHELKLGLDAEFDAVEQKFKSLPVGDSTTLSQCWDTMGKLDEASSLTSPSSIND